MYVKPAEKDKRENLSVLPLQMFSQRNNPYCDLHRIIFALLS